MHMRSFYTGGYYAFAPLTFVPVVLFSSMKSLQCNIGVLTSFMHLAIVRIGFLFCSMNVYIHTQRVRASHLRCGGPHFA